jgi:pyridoxamine 5'-phosphate oxidase
MSDKNLNPIILFQNWYEIASEKEINDPNAMCLSTVDKDNCPHSRMVLLKQ